MKNCKKLIPAFGCRNGKAVRLDNPAISYEEDILEMAGFLGDSGADELLIYDFSQTDEDHERTIGLIKEIARTGDIPIIAGGRVKRLEDVKKYLYAGAKAVFLNAAVDENVDIMKEAADRFGSEKIYTWLPEFSYTERTMEYDQLGASIMILGPMELTEDRLNAIAASGEIYLLTGYRMEAGSKKESRPGKTPNALLPLYQPENVDGVAMIFEKEVSCMDVKQELKAEGICMDTFESAVAWKDFKLNADGLMPVVVQEYRTSQVLMLAYMNEEAFNKTLTGGRMTYYSRSRKTLWLKGETSGHFQYVKSLTLDCDNDTLLAKVRQIGPACHTGAKSCFFQTLVKKEYQDTNPLKVFEDVFDVILDRKEHPKEGSYTNYLFDKGIDKILKKLGEEATEIVIAAKNPDPEEVKYEISDFLYHMMVLMADKGVSWEDITRELANR